MTKKEIVKTISEEMGLTQLKTKEIVQKTFDAIVETLVSEGRIELRNFGVFEVKKRAARKARNPRTGERVDVREKYVVTFKPGKEMEERVRELERAEAEGRPLSPRPAATGESVLDETPADRTSITTPATEPVAPPRLYDPPAAPTPATPLRTDAAHRPSENHPAGAAPSGYGAPSYAPRRPE